MSSLNAELGPVVEDGASCALGYSLTGRTTLGGAVTTHNSSIAPGQGTYDPCSGPGLGCEVGCTVLPTLNFVPSAGQVVEFETLAGASLVLRIQPVVP